MPFVEKHFDCELVWIIVRICLFDMVIAMHLSPSLHERLYRTRALGAVADLYDSVPARTWSYPYQSLSGVLTGRKSMKYRLPKIPTSLSQSWRAILILSSGAMTQLNGNLRGGCHPFRNRSLTLTFPAYMQIRKSFKCG